MYFLTVGLMGLLLEEALRRTLVARLAVPRFAEVAVALVCAASTGYVVSIIAFASPVWARIAIAIVFAWALVVVAAPRARPNGTGAAHPGDARPVVLLAAAIGVIYFSLLLCYSPDSTISVLPGSRYYEGMVSDNEIPQFYAGQLWSGGDMKAKYGDWLSSDRPPLQEGWVLLFGAPLSLVNGDFAVCAQYAGIWFQLLWVAAGWGWLRAVGVDRRGALGVMIAIAATGIFAFNTVYVWPKMAAGALLLIAYTLLFEVEGSGVAAVLGGAALALACLSHGGVAFALLGLVPFALLSLRQKGAMFWGRAVASGAAVVLPWLCYQKFFDPPGNRLLKWHLAGVIPPDSRGFVDTLLSSYRHLGWSQWLQVRESNYQTLMNGSPLQKLGFGGNYFTNRVEESFYFVRSLGWWAPAAVVVLAAMIVGRGRHWASIRRAVLWILLTLLLWGALMFIPGSTLNHQGTFACQLVLLVALGSTLWRLWKPGFWLVAALQAVDFVRIWVPPTPSAVARTFLPGPMITIALCMAVLLCLFFFAAEPESSGRS